MNNDTKLGLGLILFCGLVWFWLIPTQIRGQVQSFFPRFITLFILVPSTLLLIRGIRKRTTETGGSLLSALLESRWALGLAALFLVYVLLIAPLGFFLASLVSMVGIMLYLGERSWKQLVFTPLVLLAVIHVVIERVLSFPLPPGSLF